MLVTEERIASREDAFRLIRDFSTNRLDPATVRLNLSTFPELELHFDGQGYNAAMPFRAMEALHAIQEEMYRLYAIAAYDDPNKKLSPEEKADLELFFEIKSGSSKPSTTNFGQVFERLGMKAITKMESKHVAITIVTGIVVWGSVRVGEKLIDNNTAVQQSQSRDTAELERLKLFKDFAEKNSTAKTVIASHEETLEEISKTVRGSERVVFPNGDEVTETVAKELYPRSKRRQRADIQMNGRYRVKSLHLADENTISVESDNGTSYQAKIGVIGQEQLDALYKAKVTGEQVNLRINAVDLEGEKRDLVIVGAGVLNLAEVKN